MMSFWVFVIFVFAAAALVQSGLATLQTWENRRFARRRLDGKPPQDADEPVVLVSPCKGVDLGLDANLRALVHQDYSNYQIIFVVESDDDPACEHIRAVIASNSHRNIRLVVAGRATRCGQKVHNLRMATADLPADARILAFVDSDARPATDWLRALVSRLDRAEIGATTGYRLLVPKHATPANVLLYCVNSMIALMFGPGGHHLVWGGSWAIRRGVFDSIGLRDAWRGTLSDDLVVSRELKKARLGVEFIPECLVVSPIDSGWAAACEFMRRQYLITRCYAPKFWAFGIGVSLISNLGFWGATAATPIGFATSASWTAMAAALAATLYAGHLLRGIWRQRLTRLVLARRKGGTDRATSLAATCDIVLAPLAGCFNLILMLSSAVGRTITWRGNTYRIRQGGAIEVVRLGDQRPPSENQPSTEHGDDFTRRSRAA